MAETLALSALALFVAGTILVLVLALRRLHLAHEERRRRALEPRLRPLAFAVIDGEAAGIAEMDEQESQTLATMLARYAKQLAGSGRDNIRAFFEDGGYVTGELDRMADRRAWRRATAAYTLGNMGSDRAVPALLASLDDPAREVRAAAARSLGRLGSVGAVEPLVRALDSGSVPRAVASQALLAIGQAALPRLRQLVDDEDSGARARAVELIGLLGDPGDGALLARRVHDPAAEVRAKACRAVGRLGAGDEAAELHAALNDRIPFVRATAAIGLGMIGDRDACDDLVEQARTDSFAPAQAAARALARIDRDRVRAEARRPGAGSHLVEAADLLAFEGR